MIHLRWSPVSVPTRLAYPGKADRQPRCLFPILTCPQKYSNFFQVAMETGSDHMGHMIAQIERHMKLMLLASTVICVISPRVLVCCSTLVTAGILA